MADTQTNNESPVIKEVSSSSPVHTSGKNPRMATFWERLGAYFIDYILLSIASFAITTILNPGYFLNVSAALKGGSSSTSMAFAPMQMFATLISLVLFFGYYAYFYTTRGQTIGKKAMKLKVVQASNLKYLTIGEALLREVVRVFLSGLVFGLGYLWYFMSEKRQTWHDSIATSYVVKTDEAGNLLMDGPATYKKEPVKTFGCCGAMGLFFIAVLAFVIYGFILLGTAFSDKKNDIDSNMGIPIPPRIQNNNDTNLDMQYNFDMNQDGMPVTQPDNGATTY